ncbi:acyl-CoA dehydrogenase family protein [Nocardia pseudobrasiliensis]|uniref:Alkylation response protein AidB-like acyl-CoA dehydrogenase n=1 Tax=Nocardia pseudobrasiliensis TaxID=45979 RepID=A0A370IBX6_9NOCA|nr:acyl-CoA dehydrogenase family protein [Nocardia pseudobrasiliensis]RDI68232.1 alkylation response protein AidB-like acyl-CoA dehydrogenase [Nocardia pseudobrasiliensis]
MSSELLTAIGALTPQLTDAAGKADADRRLSDETVAAMQAAGVFRAAAPKRYGGGEAALRTHLEVAAAVAAIDGSVGWLTALWNGNDWCVAHFPEQAQDDVWGSSPDTLISGTLKPSGPVHRVPGGYRLSGAWSYASGIWHASWAIASAVLEDGPAAFLVPRTDFEIVDEWHMAGMRSTGSNRFVIEDAFVPEHRVMRLGPLVAGAHATDSVAAAFRTAMVPTLVLMVVGPQLGLGRAALAHVIAAAGNKSIPFTNFDRQSDSAGFRLQIAEAATALDTAELHAYRAADALDRHAAEAVHPDELLRARYRADAAVAARSVHRALEILMTAHGSSGFADASPLQRIWRDASVAARHGMLIPQVNLEIYGAALVGARNTVSPFA